LFEVSVRGKFSAAHRLRGYEGKCSRIHGHNWYVEVHLQSEKLSETGMVIDFGELKGILGEVLDKLDHRFINGTPPFDRINPTSENMARWIFQQLKARISDLEGVRISKVIVQESEGVTASYWE